LTEEIAKLTATQLKQFLSERKIKFDTKDTEDDKYYLVLFSSLVRLFNSIKKEKFDKKSIVFLMFGKDNSLTMEIIVDDCMRRFRIGLTRIDDFEKSIGYFFDSSFFKEIRHGRYREAVQILEKRNNWDISKNSSGFKFLREFKKHLIGNWLVYFYNMDKDLLDL
jgi:hypothetical protein